MSDLEERARWLCAQRGLDPNELISQPHPKGYPVMRWKPRWQVVSNELYDMQQVLQALDVLPRGS